MNLTFPLLLAWARCCLPQLKVPGQRNLKAQRPPCRETCKLNEPLEPRALRASPSHRVHWRLVFHLAAVPAAWPFFTRESMLGRADRDAPGHMGTSRRGSIPKGKSSSQAYQRAVPNCPIATRSLKMNIHKIRQKQHVTTSSSTTVQFKILDFREYKTFTFEKLKGFKTDSLSTFSFRYIFSKT